MARLLTLEDHEMLSQTKSNTSLAPPAGRAADPGSSRSRPNSHRKHSKHRSKTLKPDEYASAVREYSLLPTGAGQNHIALAEFLNTEALKTIDIYPQPTRDDCVIVYPLEPSDDRTPSPSQPAAESAKARDATDADTESASDKRHDGRKRSSFSDPSDFFAHSFGHRPDGRSNIVFMCGYMTATWIKTIGARFMVDPEFFCRHIDVRSAGDDSNNFSLPALPSTSWHLIEVPLITLGSRPARKGPIHQDEIDELRKKGAQELADHHHNVSKLAGSGMSVGDSIVRDYYVFDEAHFAIEQRISICMQAAEGGKKFNLLVWLDSGNNSSTMSPAWAVQPPESYFIPIIRHKHMVALKSHLFAAPQTDDPEASARQMQDIALLARDYGRSLRPNVMASDAFYCLTEILSFAASSQMEFLNTINAKLDLYTSQPAEREFQSLPNLKFTKQILYRFIEKTQRVLNSIENAKDSRWPKAGGPAEGTEPSRSHGSTRTAAHSLEQDYAHLLSFATALHKRTTEAIADLRASISISESQKGILQAQRVGRLTFLAFIFVPFSFSTSFFGMNVTQLGQGSLGIQWWVVLTAFVTILPIVVFFIDVPAVMKRSWKHVLLFCRRGHDRLPTAHIWKP